MRAKTVRKSAKSALRRKVRVGDRVRVVYAGHRRTALVVEDRGFIGVGGRQLVRIRTRLDRTDPETELEYELPAEETLPARSRITRDGKK